MAVPDVPVFGVLRAGFPPLAGLQLAPPEKSLDATRASVHVCNGYMRISQFQA
jgi:hypothetical protein